MYNRFILRYEWRFALSQVLIDTKYAPSRLALRPYVKRFTVKGQ